MPRADEVIGRDRERDLAATFVAAAASGPATLSIHGEPGIGKTTLFRYAIELARLGGSTVLECSPTHAEATMSYAGLTDMLHALPDSAFEALPAPQRHALEVATLRAEPSGVAIDERSVGTGLSTLLVHLANVNAVILAVDDLQWLDRSSNEVLTFAARRLTAAAVGLLTCQRTEASEHHLVDAVQSPLWRDSMSLAGLGAAALFHLVRDQLGISLPRPALVRVAETSGGNPFAALALSRAGSHGDDVHGSGDGRVSELVHGLTTARMSDLTAPAREALLVVALSPRAMVSVFGLLGLGEALEEVASNSIVRIVDGRVSFAHPLLASSVTQEASAEQQRVTHSLLAKTSDDPEARARHRALAISEPDEATALELDGATSAAAARGSSIAAAELARLALDRTVDGDSLAAWTRRLRLAELLHAAGSTLEAGAVLEGNSCPAGAVRARVSLILTEVAYQTSTLQAATDHATAALADARGDAALEARCLLALATISPDGKENARLTGEARRLLASAGIEDPQLLAWAECQAVSARFHMGEGLDRADLDHALTLERKGRTWLSGDQVAAIRPVLLKWADYPHAALADLAELRARAEGEGNDGLIPYVAGHVPGILLRLGRLRDAALAAADHLDLAERTGQESQRMQALYNVSLVAAHLGELTAARAAADEIHSWALSNNDVWLEMSATSALGFIAISSGDTTAARSQLDRWADLIAELGVVDPGVSRFFGDHIESLVACGEIGNAISRTEDLERRSSRASRVSASAIAARCRGLLAAAAGDPVSALEHVQRSLERDAECPVPFERHRTLLLAGVIHRRARHKSAARSALAEAAKGFGDMGAVGWAQRCETEFQRVGTPARNATTLTATEQRVAELAASGLTNRQVAEKAFLSPKTVEANLARVYRKLNITSRAELGARMGR